MIEIGNRIETPEGVFYELEYGGEGNIYKNEDAFLNRPDEVCYVPEYAAEDREDWRVSESSDGCFTHNSLLALCKGPWVKSMAFISCLVPIFVFS